jgi:hypothetical protein
VPSESSVDRISSTLRMRTKSPLRDLRLRRLIRALVIIAPPGCIDVGVTERRLPSEAKLGYSVPARDSSPSWPSLLRYCQDSRHNAVYSALCPLTAEAHAPHDGSATPDQQLDDVFSRRARVPTVREVATTTRMMVTVPALKVQPEVYQGRSMTDVVGEILCNQVDCKSRPRFLKRLGL